MTVAFRGAAVAAAVLVWSVSAAAQTKPTVEDAARQESLVREALARYQSGLQELNAPEPAQTQLGVLPPGGVRELRLGEAVQLALDKNLDIAVERLNPQAIDLQIAQIKNAYLPVMTSTVGYRDAAQLPRDQLTGQAKVSQTTGTYNAGLTQTMSKYGGSFTMNWTNTRLETSNSFQNYNPSLTTSLSASYTQPLLRGFVIDQNRQQLLVTQINREISEDNVRATVTTTLANVRNAYWDLVFARSAVDVAQRAVQLADKLVEDNKARVEVGTLAPLDIVQAEAEAATRRQTLAAAEATLQTAQLALKRFIVSGTDDPLWRQELRPIDLPSLEAAPTTADIEGAVRRALQRRTDLSNARNNLESSDVNLKYFRNQMLPDVDLIASYGAQGIGGWLNRRSGLGGSVTEVVPGGYGDALRLLRSQEYPNWNLQMNFSYNLGGSQAEAQHARARVQRSQAQTRLRALELQVATEVTNAALQVQSNLRRVEAAQAARELAEKRLEAEQSKFEVGMSTNFFVVQAQRDLRDAQNTELRALADYRKSLVTFERAQEAPAGAGGGGNFGGTNTNAGGGGGGQ